MFCLDYAFGFAAHYALLMRYPLDSSPLGALFAGTAAGAAAAVLLFPFDVVRHEVARAQGVASSSAFAMSTVPFMGAYLGLYFGARPRDDAPLLAKARWALVSTAVAAAVELPFDQARDPESLTREISDRS